MRCVKIAITVTHAKVAIIVMIVQVVIDVLIVLSAIQSQIVLKYIMVSIIVHSVAIVMILKNAINATHANAAKPALVVKIVISVIIKQTNNLCLRMLN